ncbi:hypothetical protein [Mycobacterium sp.]|uniref:hypothetical protein n=1 Tax=Mycobacterium sp. TaxID=1785 RepID=UPI003A8C171C
MGHVTAGYVGSLASLNGTTVTINAMNAAFVPPELTVDISTVGTPIDTVTSTATWNTATSTLTVADVTGLDANGVAYFAITDGSDDVITTVTVTDPVDIAAADTVTFPLGIAKLWRNLEQRIAALEAEHA